VYKAGPCRVLETPARQNPRLPGSPPGPKLSSPQDSHWSEKAVPVPPAVVRKVVLPPRDANFFNLDVYPLARRSRPQGLSTRLNRTLRPLETLTQSATSV
jgi:hypothetical protein